MQDMLGALNDAATAARLAGQIHLGKDLRENAEVIAYLKGYADAQLHFSLTDFKFAWKKFKAAKIFW